MKVIFLGCGYLGYNLYNQLKDTFDAEVWGIDSPYVEYVDSFKYVNAFNPLDMAKMDVKDAIVVDTVALVANNAESDNDDIALKSIQNKYRILVDCLKEGGAKRFVFLSSGGTIYGDSLEPISEGELIHPKTLYAKSKAAVEDVLQKAHMDYLILRLANPYGGYQIAAKKQGVIPILIRKAIMNETFEMWNNKDSIRDYIYIEDFATALKLLIQNDISREIVNIGSGKGESLETLIQLTEKYTEHKIDIQYKQSNVQQVQAIVLDISKLKRLTGFEPKVSIEQGVQYEVERIKKEISK